MIKNLGNKIINFEKIDSTQKEIWRRIEKGQIENKIIIKAEIQTDAIGTHGRNWYTNQKNNIAFSFVLFLNTNIERIKNISIEIAEDWVDILKENYNIEVQIKSPNDLMIKSKKVGGILTETKIQGEKVKCLVIGIGINTNQTEFPKEIKEIATSIKTEFGINIDNDKLIQEFCNKFEKRIIKEIGEKK